MVRNGTDLHARKGGAGRVLARKAALVIGQVFVAVLVIAVHQAFAQTIDLGPLNQLMDRLGCSLRTFGPYLAFLFGIIGVVLVVASSHMGIRYIGFAIFGVAVLAAFPRLLVSIVNLFGMQMNLSCR